MRPAVLLVPLALAILVQPALAQDPARLERIRKLKEEIDLMRERLFTLEEEMLRFDRTVSRLSRVELLRPDRLQVGQAGPFAAQDDQSHFVVVRVLSPIEAILRHVSPTRPEAGGQQQSGSAGTQASSFVLRGLPTGRWMEGKRVPLLGDFKVLGSVTLNEGQSVFVVAPLGR